MTPLRWGILSTARIVDRVLGAARFVAVASCDADRARTWAQERGIAKAYGSYDELLADQEIDAVYIAVPTAMRIPWSIAALRAGKHVLCETPLSRDAAAVDEAFDVAEQEGRLLNEALMWRHHPQVDATFDILRSGAIGAPRLARAEFSFPLRREGDLLLEAERDGGALMDVGPYCVSAARTFVAAEPEAAIGDAVHFGDEPDDVDAAFAGILRFADGALATFDAGIDRARASEVEVVGETGRVRLTDPWYGRDPLIELSTGPEAVEQLRIERADPYTLEFADFEAAARGERPPLLGREDAVGQARALDGLQRSATEGRLVAIGG